MKKINSAKLFRHQLTSIKLFTTLTRGLDASDPGTGKTRVQVELVDKRVARGAGLTLVICPRSIMRSTWEEEFRKFAPKLEIQVCPAYKREERFKKPADVYITNIDATRWLMKQRPKFFEKFEILIVDEIMYFKHHTSQRSKALDKIKKYFTYRYGLTGSIASNALTDIWHPMKIIDDGRRLGVSFFNFRSAVCSPVQVGALPQMVEWQEKPGAQAVVTDLIRDLTVRHVFEDCVDIPPNYQYTIPYMLEPRQQRVYDKMEQEAIVAFKDGTITSAVNAASVVTKLLQIASGAVYNTDRRYTLIDNGRYELIADTVEAREKCLVFYNWLHQAEELYKEFKRRGITCAYFTPKLGDKARADMIEAFQNGFYRVFLAHPASAGHGLTLTQATSTIFATPSSNLELVLQGKKRIHRISQKHKTETIFVVAPGTIEERVMAALDNKTAKQLDMMKLLKEMTER